MPRRSPALSERFYVVMPIYHELASISGVVGLVPKRRRAP
jgi:hypothetical protein